MSIYHTALVDTSGLLYRYLTIPTDDPVQFTVDKILRFMRDLEPVAETRILAWDSPKGTSRRRELHLDYKGHRPPKPKGFQEACEKLREEAVSEGILHADSDGEADDIAAHLARTCDGKLLLVSKDKDWLLNICEERHTSYCSFGMTFSDAPCCCSPNTVHVMRPDMSRPPKGVDWRDWQRPDPEFVTEASLREKGIQLGKVNLAPPATVTHIRDMLALVGDAVDHVPGVEGIGDRKALSILRACGDLSPVDLVLEKREEELRALVAATAPKVSPLVERLILGRSALELTLKLLEPLDVDVRFSGEGDDL